MKFNLGLILRGKPIVSCVKKDERTNRIEVELDLFGNRSSLSFDSICLESFAEALGEYSKNGALSYRQSESCQSRVDLDSFSLDLSDDKKFSARLVLGDIRGSCELVLRSGFTQISLCFNEAQLSKIMAKFSGVLRAKEALGEAEAETVL